MPNPTTTNPDENAIDIALMKRVRDGDTVAFQELVERHQNAVIGTVAKMLNGSSDAEDIAQQVFIRLWKSAKRYQEKAKFTTFLYTITRNLVFNESKRRSRKKHASLEERTEESHLDIPAKPESHPDNEMLQSELQKAVDNAIHQLPEKQRLAVILRRYENLPYEEIASVLKISVSAVKSQLFRARGMLRESLSHYLDQ